MKRIAAAMLILVVAACTASPSPSGSTAPTAAPTPAPTSAPTMQPSSGPTQAPTTAPTPAPEPTADLGDFVCTYPYAVDGDSVRAQISDVRVGAHRGYDRIVFEFEDGIPAMDVKVGTPPLTYDPSGLPMEVAGSDFVVFILRGGTGLGPSGRVTYDGPTEFMPGYPLLVELEQAGDFEAQSEWVAGLTGPACIRVFTLAGPDRLVIDVAAQ